MLCNVLNGDEGDGNIVCEIFNIKGKNKKDYK